MNQQHTAGFSRAHFTLVGLVQDEDTTTGVGVSLEEGGGKVYEIDIIEANPSVTDATIVSIQDDGTVGSVRDYEINQYLLVAANQEVGDFALLTMDGLTNQVNGMAKKAGDEIVKVQQLPGASTVVTQAEDFFPPKDWTCGVEDSSSSINGDHRRRDTEGVVEPSHDGHRHGHKHHDHDHKHDH